MRKRILMAAVLAVGLTTSAHASLLSGFIQGAKQLRETATSESSSIPQPNKSAVVPTSRAE